MAVAYDNNDICTFALSNLLPSLQSSEPEVKEVAFSFIYNGFHSGPITAMSLCMQRPLIATACEHDSSIRLWNYSAMRCDLAKQFQLPGNTHPLLTLSIHPSGYYLAASFTDKVRLFYILDDHLKIYQEVMQASISALNFSNRGHLLAMGQKLHPFNIYIYHS